MAMMRSGPGPFMGFRPEALQFLADLAANNDRSLVPAPQGRL